MLKKMGLVVVGLALIAGLGACAKQYEEYGIKPGGPHYASFSHMGYSNRRGEKPKLTKEEAKLAKEQGWWGSPIAYNIDELE